MEFCVDLEQMFYLYNNTVILVTLLYVDRTPDRILNNPKYQKNTLGTIHLVKGTLEQYTQRGRKRWH